MRVIISFSILYNFRGGVGNECAIGYKDKLCAVCESEVDGKLYARSGATDCSECQNLAT